jgi:hypothetical protein
LPSNGNVTLFVTPFLVGRRDAGDQSPSTLSLSSRRYEFVQGFCQLIMKPFVKFLLIEISGGKGETINSFISEFARA